MLLDFARPISISEVGYFKLLLRGLLLSGMMLMLLYISYTEENPTSFVYFTFGGFIFASKMRLRSQKVISKDAFSQEEKEELAANVRDNKKLFDVKYLGRSFYLFFAVVMTVIFGCSLAYNKMPNDNDIYPFFQIKPEEMKTKYLLVVWIMSWLAFFLDLSCGRSYHWNELMVYERFHIKQIQSVCEYLLVFLIFSFSQQVKFSIFSLIFFFFVLVTITVFLFSLLSEKNKEVSFDGYISFLKWLTLAGMIVIYLKKSYSRFIEIFGKHSDTNSIGKDLKDLIDQFIDKEENFDRILVIFILSSLRQYFADIGNMIKNIKGILDDKQTIEAESLFVTFFSENILLLMNKRGSDMINYNRAYKTDYFYELEQVPEIKTKFETIFSKVKVKITTTEKYILFFKKIVQGAIGIALNILKNHTVLIFQVILNYLVIYNTQYMMLMVLPIIWCMLSFVAFSPGFATSISIIFLYVPTSLAILQVVASNILCKTNGVIYKMAQLGSYCSFMNRYPILSENSIQTAMEGEKERLFRMLTLTIIYIILLIEKKKNLKYMSFVVDKMSSLGQEIKNNLYDDLKILIKFIISKIFSNFFYICLIFLLLAIIQTISLFNFGFIGFFFYFILNAEKAKKYWIFLLLYLQFLLIIRFLYSLKIFTFNLDRETNAMVGLYFGTGNPKEERQALLVYWYVLIAISVQYQLFYTKLALEFKRVELKFKSKILEKLKLVAYEVQNGLYVLYMNSMIWFFHFFLVLILIFSERTVFNVILMLMEAVFFSLHLQKSRGLQTIESRKSVNKWWMIILVAILFFSFLFYIFLFCKYTVTKRFVMNLLSLDDKSPVQVKSGYLNSRIREEFTMMYLLRQKKLELETNSFIRENLKILLAFVSFFKIIHERGVLKAEEDRSKAGRNETVVLNDSHEMSDFNNELDLDVDDDDEKAVDLDQIVQGKKRDNARKSIFGGIKDEDDKLAFGFEDIKQIFDKLLVYLSHVWKSVILVHIVFWNIRGPNIFKITILAAILVTFYRYLNSATSIMVKSKLLEILQKSRLSSRRAGLLQRELHQEVRGRARVH